MGNRIIKESIRTSEKLAALSDFAYRVWTSLITMADDTGCGDGRAAIIKGFAFPLRESVTVEAVREAMEELEAVGCIRRYTVEGREYFCFPHWASHQRIRNVKPRFPGPDQGDGVEQPVEPSVEPVVSVTQSGLVERVAERETPVTQSEPAEKPMGEPASPAETPRTWRLAPMVAAPAAEYDALYEHMGPERCRAMIRLAEQNGQPLPPAMVRWRERHPEAG